MKIVLFNFSLKRILSWKIFVRNNLFSYLLSFILHQIFKLHYEKIN